LEEGEISLENTEGPVVKTFKEKGESDLLEKTCTRRFQY